MSNKRKRFTVVTANFDKERADDRKYLRRILNDVKGPMVLFMQERGRGLRSVRFRKRGIKVLNRALLVLGRVGVHRGVRRMRIRVGGQRITLFNIHGLHKRSVGKHAHDKHILRLAKRTKRLNRKGKLWLVGGDFNEALSSAARKLGGRYVGHRIDGFVYSEGLKMSSVEINYVGMKNNWTDHPYVSAKVSILKSRR